MKLYIVALMLLCNVKGYTQTDTNRLFAPPFKFPLTLSGNFGELRANHFHGGLDFKTGGIRKPVYALGEGYISKIRVTSGSGFVLEVCYENGYQTINRHLDGFTSPIAEIVKQLQYEKESWEVEIVPAVGEYPVKAGQQIAWSGNTGYSAGPHLHLDVLDKNSGDHVDPLPLFAGHIKDTRAPLAQGIMFFPQIGRGVVDGGVGHKVISPRYNRPVEAWGWIGTGIKAYDYMNGVSNHYGVYSVTLSVDGEKVFQSEVDRFSADENRMINSWVYGGYMKSFIEPGNRLRLLKTYNAHRGLIQINEERDYHFLYTLKDALGNTSQYRFVVRGKEQSIAPIEHREKYLFEWDKTNFLQEPGMTLVVPQGMLYDDVPLYYQVKADSGDVAYTYQLNDKYTPLHAGCELKIGVRRKVVTDTTKYYIARVMPNGKTYSAGGQYKDGFVRTLIRELGTYTVKVDTVPPSVTPIAKTAWGRQEKIRYRVSDRQTGIASFRGTIDGKYALFRQPNTMRPYWECELDPTHFKRGGKHVVEFTVVDHCGNRSVSHDILFW